MTQGNTPQKPTKKTTAKSSGASKGNKVDLTEVRRLVTLMEKHDLVEVEIEQEDKRLRVKRRGDAATTYAVPAAAPSPAGTAPAPGAAEAPAEEKRGAEIPSPMVGTFYRAPSPDAAPFVEVGDRITADSVVCIVEAMKVMNEIKAEVAGEILEILVQNGEPVEFGQPLFLVKN